MHYSVVCGANNSEGIRTRVSTRRTSDVSTKRAKLDASNEVYDRNGQFMMLAASHVQVANLPYW
jgi:hypothetical protein